MEFDENIQLYADGACSPNPGMGGWAYILRCEYTDNGAKGIHEKFNSGFDPATTNNRMEIIGVLEGLRAIKHKDTIVTVTTDSQYVVKTMTAGWNRKQNKDLWPQLDAEVAKFKEVKWVWIRGHGDNEFNNRCDVLAVSEYKRRQGK